MELFVTMRHLLLNWCVWHEDYAFYSRKVISNHISNIKKKIRVISDSHKYIVSVYGIGYKFDPDF